MTDFTPACRLSDIPAVAALAVDIEGIPVALVRCGDEILAVSNTCSHANVALSEGEVDTQRCTIECWLHGSAFDLRTGQALTPPAVLPIATYTVRIEGSGADAEVLVSTNPGRQS
jgi:3-phenylpropionate/trans-cinnamate dioxygenase ferredoxin subunit